MKKSIKYSLLMNGATCAVNSNKIHTSYFSKAPQATMYVQAGDGLSDMDFNATALENYQVKIGSVNYSEMNKVVSQLGQTVVYNFNYTWGVVSGGYVGSLCEVGTGYRDSSTDFEMISRTRFLDDNNEPVLIEITEYDVLGLKIDIEILKSITSEDVSFELSDGKIATGKLYEVNLQNWFQDNLASPLPSSISMVLFNSTNLNFISSEMNKLEGTLSVEKSTATAKTSTSSFDVRSDKYGAYFPPSDNYTVSYLGLCAGSNTIPQNYYVVVVLDEPLLITEEDEFTIAITLEQTEGDINGNTQ